MSVTIDVKFEQQLDAALDFGKIPTDLTEIPQWVLWKEIRRDDKQTKMPLSVYRKPASSTDPADWAGFENVVTRYDPDQDSGIGFVFTASDDLFGIDLDGCRDSETGTLAPWAQQIVDNFETYAEVSPSGTGVKLFCRSERQLPKGKKKTIDADPVCSKTPGVEAYSQGRYFTVTGHALNGHSVVSDCTRQVGMLLEQYWPYTPPQAAEKLDWHSNDAVVERARTYVAKMPAAVSGERGHDQTFSVACRLVQGFELSPSRAMDVLQEYNLRCDPQWSEHELQHKIDDAEKQSGERGYLRNAKPERYETILKRREGQEEQSAGIDFQIIDSKTFAETNFTTDFMIDGIMTDGQPQLYGGPSKSLKTSVMVDQVLSLAAKVPFLGKYDVPKAKRCLLLSSESGSATLQETAVRICKDKDIILGDLGDQMHWGFRPPLLNAADHILTLQKFILRERIEVIGIDPAYLSMNLAGNDASNQFAVGAVLGNLTRLQADTGVTPILAAHFRMHMPPGTMPSLEHIAGAGFGQWARQWVLLNRREPFNDESPGSHKLFLAYGGSAGHAGAVALDIEEGRIQDGRIWNVTLSQLSAVREQLEIEREERKQQKEQTKRENRRVAILRVMRKFPKGEAKTQIRTAAGLNPTCFEPVFQDLLSSQDIEPCEFDRDEVKKDGSLRTRDGFRIVDPASRGTRTHKNTQEHVLQ